MSRPGWRSALAAIGLVAAVGCTPQAAVISAVMPDGVVPVLLSHFQGLDEGNRRRIVAFEQQRDWAGLARFAEENLARDRHSADWWLIAGYAHSQLGNRGRATECYAEVVRLAPDDLLGWNLLAQLHLANGQPEHAVRTLENALLVRRDSAATFFLLGESYSALRRHEAAISSYREAVRLDRAFAHAWLGMGRAYARLGRADEVARVRAILEKLNPALAQQLADLPPAR